MFQNQLILILSFVHKLSFKLLHFHLLHDLFYFISYNKYDRQGIHGFQVIFLNNLNCI
jgi:hypothetical protein